MAGRSDFAVPFALLNIQPDRAGRIDRKPLRHKGLCRVAFCQRRVAFSVRRRKPLRHKGLQSSAPAYVITNPYATRVCVEKWHTALYMCAAGRILPDLPDLTIVTTVGDLTPHRQKPKYQTPGIIPQNPYIEQDHLYRQSKQNQQSR